MTADKNSSQVGGFRPLLLQYHSRPVTALTVNKDGDLFLSSSNDGRVNLCRTATGDRIGCYEGHGSAAVKSCDINLSSTLVVSGGADSHVCFYEAETGKIIYRFDHGGILKSVEFNQNPDNNTMIVTANDKFMSVPNQISVFGFNFENPEKPLCERTLVIDNDLPTRAARVRWGPFDETLISIHQEGTFVVWDVREGHKIKLIEAHQGPCTSLQFNLTRTLMVTCSRDQTVKLWETQNYQCIKKFSSNRPFNDAAISPLYTDETSPKFHIIAGGGVEARDVTTSAEGGFESVIFNMVMEEEIGQIRGHFGPMNAVAIGPDGSYYITGGEEGLIRLIHFDPEYFKRADL